MVCFALPHSPVKQEKKRRFRHYWPAVVLGSVLLYLGFRLAQPPAPAAPERPALSLHLKDLWAPAATPAPRR